MDNQEQRLAHLSALADGSAGALIRGLHSFLEDYLRDDPSRARPGRSFSERLAAFAQSSGGMARAARAAETRGLVKRLAAEHELAFRAAWSAAEPDAGEAAAAAHNFLQFAELAGIDSASLDGLRAFRDAWLRRTAPGEGGALREVMAELVAARADERTILEQTARWVEDKKKLAELEGEVQRLAAALARESARESPSADRLEGIRGETRALEGRRAELEARLASYRDLDHYVRHAGRFSLYTRTRRDYERGLMQLTPEQREAADAMRGGRDVLVRGAAGTGKTIVLIHALARALAERSRELALGPRGRVLLLTYTTTLVKYDRYIADILGGAQAEGIILTVDRFLAERLELLGERQRVDYRAAQVLAEQLNTAPFFTPQEMATEVEDFIFANLVTRQEYLEERIPRRGMR
ncbi:MAG TPA: DEAD/DEAH box helicase family protein, partial [Spirochaetia bacterium]|nr:DEAD/DEAH box helicase family protein [Spirochaetia bacterium]